MASGFSFLRTQFPGLEKTGEFAERYLYSDSNSCLFKLGLLCEDIVNKMFDFDNIAMPYQMKDTLVNKIRYLVCGFASKRQYTARYGRLAFFSRLERNAAGKYC
ncbi:hypothetical protein [uncultured Phascolarctobacterium sp.]|uniref:hypothetical protein n=1 Tax=uncultured Phascolarctobacterium sp. TaxID=512296 RepID=UPI00262F59D8|nr:hypothetical protein [uncultured Phascolarctobacterium sp.]